MEASYTFFTWKGKVWNEEFQDFVIADNNITMVVGDDELRKQVLEQQALGRSMRATMFVGEGMCGEINNDDLIAWANGGEFKLTKTAKEMRDEHIKLSRT